MLKETAGFKCPPNNSQKLNFRFINHLVIWTNNIPETFETTRIAKVKPKPNETFWSRKFGLL